MHYAWKLILKSAGILALLYIAGCVLVYFIQERLLFFPEKLPQDYTFRFNEPFEEHTIRAGDGTLLNGLLFRADTSRGLIFYLHGNAGGLNKWGELAATYMPLRYDVFMFDYRGYGKSGGAVKSELQFYEDAQTAYDSVKKWYPENKITILGYSIGTAAAAMLASKNNPQRLILQAPYYSLRDMAQHTYPYLPSFLLKYTFATYRYVKETTAPVTIFHGDKDEVIYYESSSVKLKACLKPGDTLITLPGQGHNGMTDNPDYLTAIRRILE